VLPNIFYFSITVHAEGYFQWSTTDNFAKYQQTFFARPKVLPKKLWRETFETSGVSREPGLEWKAYQTIGPSDLQNMKPVLQTAKFPFINEKRMVVPGLGESCLSFKARLGFWPKSRDLKFLLRVHQWRSYTSLQSLSIASSTDSLKETL